ncbi:DnaA N-terminal domain-containing protein [Sphingobium sp. IP1]|uniref:DnaA N-terminal domain-containing protein n=1 Tax=Sphingobium sp. IP1 TaxID=2021637 RepID=UPI00117B9AC6|nr:DnaA N-terminal domain-containing protein [Sphingobium sp. IP1]
MSIRLMNVVLGADMDHLSTTERYVLLVLADSANDDGVTWIPIKGRADKRSIMKKTSLSERAVQNCLRSLETAGHVTRDERPGRGVMYTLHPRTKCTPARRAPKPLYKPDSPLEPNGSSPPEGAGGTGSKRNRGSRIPEDWSPPSIADLPPSAKAKASQWPAGAYEAEAEAFHSFWLGESRAGSRKSDWNRAWYNRINEITGRVLRDARAGVKVTAPKSPATAPAGPLRIHDTSRENAGARKIRDGIRKLLGDQVYDQWIAPSRLDVQGDKLTLVAISAFASNYQRDNFANDIARAMHAVLGPDAELRFHHERPPA